MPNTDSEYKPSDSDTDESNSQASRTGKKKSKYCRIAFSLEDEERLIELVKANPLLYSPSNSDFKDKTLKGKAWENISNTLSKSSDDCKKKWKNIKDQYDRTRKKNCRLALQIQIKSRGWKFCHF